MIDALDIHVKGIVQGVGFRPFVYRLAKKYLINGWVMNTTDGVHIRAEGDEKLVDEFVMELADGAPAAAKITEIEMKEVPIEPYHGFEIRFSDDAEADRPTLVSPDMATCPDCARELFDPSDRRYRYPFINCTNCGPRFTILDELPYDRGNTSMRDFAMCEACQAEYDNPADRRFHAQPNACFECGPHVSWSSDGGNTIAWGTTRAESDAIFAKAVEALLEGKILAVKGLGGFHLACDANNANAVAELRRRKRREGKPFAVMMNSLDDVRSVCEVGPEETAALSGSVRPIVLLRKQMQAEFAPGLADELPELGVMLPYTPVQHILLHDFAQASQADEARAAHALNPPMLVMTSGNLHDEPIVTDDGEAYSKLGKIADAFLGNNREILSRFDDSVVRVIRAGSAGEAVQMIRRSRGYAPTPVTVTGDGSNVTHPQSATPTIFAAGPEQKNTFAFLRDGDAYVSQHIGDMENAEAFDAWLAAKHRYEKLFDLHASRLVCDLHPEYITSKWAHEHSTLHQPPLPLLEVQHHHAHIASVLAENSLRDAVCGIAFDGTGYGVDGNIWGGEVLMANQSDFERFANFAYVPMPGGAAAVKHPLQMAYGVLWEFDLLEHPGAAGALAALGEAQAQTCDAMIEQGINTPVTSSVGRLFDAASALLDICTQPAYEGEAAILLEAALWNDGSQTASQSAATQADDQHGADAYTINVVKNVATDTSTAHDTSVLLFDAAPAFTALLDDVAAGVAVGTISRRFHDAFVNIIVQAAQFSLALYGIKTVALSGGVFMNRYLMEHALAALEQAGFTVAINRELPPNDGCVSYGEAVVSFAKTEVSREE